jgi:hypothetical protein
VSADAARRFTIARAKSSQTASEGFSGAGGCYGTAEPARAALAERCGGGGGDRAALLGGAGTFGADWKPRDGSSTAGNRHQAVLGGSRARRRADLTGDYAASRGLTGPQTPFFGPIVSDFGANRLHDRSEQQDAPEQPSVSDRAPVPF